MLCCTSISRIYAMRPLGFILIRWTSKNLITSTSTCLKLAYIFLLFLCLRMKLMLNNIAVARVRPPQKSVLYWAVFSTFLRLAFSLKYKEPFMRSEWMVSEIKVDVLFLLVVLPSLWKSENCLLQSWWCAMVAKALPHLMLEVSLLLQARVATALFAAVIALT